mmetsp:Transcript_16568/g.46328  ORF Transcript_16568/g.46328 Transcript_16568/m.46328 type:complete len:265 (-) Transcript_16568:1680-2474(-)
MGDHAEHAHVTALADAVGTILRLQVHHRIPVAVVDDNSAGGCQVQSETAGSCGEKEDEVRRIRRVELVHALLTLFGCRGTIQPQRQVPAVGKVIFEDRHDGSHLGEHEDAMAGSLELREHLIEQRDFSRTPDDVLVDVVSVRREQVRVVANLAQLHHDIVQTATGRCPSTLLVDRLAADLLVEFLLPRRQVASQNLLDLFGQLIQYFALDAPQHERTQQFVQTMDDEHAFFVGKKVFFLFRSRSFLVLAELREWLVEPLIERFN